MAKSALSSRRKDGRHQRSERTRQLLVEAYLGLLREGVLVPTAAEIAKRAGYSTRSVFERFADTPALSLAAFEYVSAQIAIRAAPQNVDGDRKTRILSYVEGRSLICEEWLPLWRALIRFSDRADHVKALINRIRNAIVDRLRLMFASEVSTLSDVERRELLVVLEALVDFDCWGRMRERHGLSYDAAQRIWIKAIDKLLPGTPLAR